MQGERIYFSDQNLNSEQSTLIEGTNIHFQHTFKSFLHNFNRDNTRPYHRQLSAQIHKNKHVLPLELSDLKGYDEQLYEKLIASPMEMLRVMEEGARNYVR
jgi:DNA replicative helicase MCM subunit Mcm2 (Cdc46/Mcm family)